ncbi:hypothetical protein ACWGCW_07515 [Streptomyces sp. NPDC054933]
MDRPADAQVSVSGWGPRLLGNAAKDTELLVLRHQFAALIVDKWPGGGINSQYCDVKSSARSQTGR